MFIRRGHEPNGTVKVAIIKPRKEAQTIGLNRSLSASEIQELYQYGLAN